MPTNGQFGGNSVGRWRRVHSSVSAKLIALLLAAMVVIFALLGYLNIRLHRKHLEAATLAAADRVSDTIKRSTSYDMMRNDRAALYEYIGTVGGEPGVVRIRIINSEGRISFSTDPKEVDTYIDKRAEACYACHAQAQPLTKLNRPDRFRIYRVNDSRVLGIINPIENQPDCTNAACHAHPASQQILGVLDTNLSLAPTDADLHESSRQMLAYTIVAVLLISGITFLFVWRVVARPVRALTTGTERLSWGELGYQIKTGSADELGQLATSFNLMSLQLEKANQEITSWARTLEERVEEKGRELQSAHEQVLQVEKMASLGKMAAVVAHEVNNPLSGILTYSKLLKKWLDRLEMPESRRKEMRECLDIIESESRRCGEMVKNLLTFSRARPMNFEWANLNQVVERAAKLVAHKLELGNVQVQLELASDLPSVQCDPAQIEQVLLALIMNAHDAMPRGGNLWLLTRSLPQSQQIEIQVRDDGVGIPPEMLPKLFEPFFTTKESSKGVGLGLAIARTIVERHRGQIEVESELGKGTTFYIFLPVNATAAPASTPVIAGAASR